MRTRSARDTGCSEGSKRTARIGRPSYSLGTDSSPPCKTRRPASRNQLNRYPAEVPFAICGGTESTRRAQVRDLTLGGRSPPAERRVAVRENLGEGGAEE